MYPDDLALIKAHTVDFLGVELLSAETGEGRG